MAKKKQHLKPDTVSKNYWRDNEQFADLFNAVLFHGEQIIKPEELETEDTEDSFVLEHREFAKSMEASRDTIKIRKKSLAHGVEFVLLGLEGQEYVHYAMPMRIMGYDYGTYKKQYDLNAKDHRAAKDLKDGNEYLSGMKRTDKFTPVITVVIYYGEKPWDGAASLHGMLHIPEQMKEFVNDYKMLLVEARQNNLIFHNINNKDLFNLLEILLDKHRPWHETKDMAIEYANKHNTDKSVIMTATGAVNCKLNYDSFDIGGADMCTVFEENWADGKAVGLAEGKTAGLAEGIVETAMECGLSNDRILDKLQKKLNISISEAQEFLDRYSRQMV